ncbi:hypothetical protein Bca4012_098798 [Brassica carinata]
MRTETFEQFSQTVAKCHKLVELSPALMLSLFLDSLDQELCRLSIIHHSKKLHGLLIVARKDRGRLSGYSIAGETLKSSPTTVFLAIISSDFLVINNRNLSMQKDVEQKFMLSFVDMECEVIHTILLNLLKMERELFWPCH